MNERDQNESVANDSAEQELIPNAPVQLPGRLIPLLQDYVLAERQRAANELQVELNRVAAQQQAKHEEELRLAREAEFHHERDMAELADKSRARREYLLALFGLLLIFSLVFLLTLHWNKEAVFIEWGKAIISLIGLILTFMVGKAYGERARREPNNK